jgi:hypothetical protein
MSKSKETFCSLKKDDIKNNLDDIKRLVRAPRFVCRTCARAAHDETRLCKPVAI